MIDLMFWEGYSVHDYDIGGGGDRAWYANFALIDKSRCPIERDSDGVMSGADDALTYASMEMNEGTLRAANNETLGLKHSTPLDVMGYSSSFWTAGIVEASKAKYFLLHESISTGSLGSTTVYLNDGGLVDTTGIVTLLQLQTPKIVAFYNNNDPLSSLSSVFSYLFGVGAATDTMNSLEGPELGAVFPEELYGEFISNLTDPNVMRATLSDVPVSDNSYLGVSGYSLSSLVVFSNEYSDAFLDSFDDAAELRGGLDERWPNQFPVSLSAFDSNMLAMKADWLVVKYAEELEALLG